MQKKIKNTWPDFQGQVRFQNKQDLLKQNVISDELT